MQGQKSKSFTIKVGDEEKALYFKRPTMQNLFDMDLEYRKIYAEALRQGIATESEIRKKSKNTGAWNMEDQDKISDLSLEVAKLEVILKGSVDNFEEANVKIAERISKTRRELIELIQQRTGLFSNTVEDFASQQRMHKFIELCCCEESGTKFFDNREEYEDFVSNNTDQASELYKQAYLYEYDTPDDITESWAEVAFFKKMLEKEKQKLEANKIVENVQVEVTVPEDLEHEDVKKKGKKKKDN